MFQGVEINEAGAGVSVLSLNVVGVYLVGRYKRSEGVTRFRQGLMVAPAREGVASSLRSRPAALVLSVGPAAV